DVDLALRADRDAARVRETAGRGAVRAPAPLVRVARRRAEAHDAVVEVVGDEQAPGGVGGDVVGVGELARVGALAGADRPEYPAAGVEDDEAMVAVVGDGDARAADRQALR